jgi:hypothetical protein
VVLTGVVLLALAVLLCFLAVCANRGGGETELGNAPGISSLSSSAASLLGAVRGVCGCVSCESDTLLGVEELRPRRRAELRLAMISKLAHKDVE